MSLDVNDVSQKLSKLECSNDSSSSVNKTKTKDSPKDEKNEAPVPMKKKKLIDHKRIASYAFAFDIDGVLVRGSETIPVAPRALQMLNGDNKYNIKVPYIFVTNGGGRTEQKRCDEMSSRLGVPVSPDQFIQGHTPMRDLAHKFRTVLVIGGVGEACRLVAEEYGFEDVVTPGDILKWNPNVSPYRTLTEQEYKDSRTRDFSKTEIEAILVFADSRDWASDQQIILDLLMSKKGVMGTFSKTFDEGPEIYFAHNDFVWATNYNLSRYGMGALQVSISALYQAHTGKPLKVNKYGKPHRATFEYADKVLADWRQDTFEAHFSPTASDAISVEPSPVDTPRSNSISEPRRRSSSSSKNGTTMRHMSHSSQRSFKPPSRKGSLVISEGGSDDDADVGSEADETYWNQDEYAASLPAASTVYFVGDTPDSDIRFANSFDKRWYSILVETGVYQKGTKPAYQPRRILPNCLEAVKFAIEREHRKEVAIYNACVEAGVPLPVDRQEDLHPHLLERLVEQNLVQAPVLKTPALDCRVTTPGTERTSYFTKSSTQT